MNNLRKDLTFIVMFSACSFIAGIILSKNIFETFTPRSYVLHNPVLIFLQSATSFILFVCFFVLSIYNFLLYVNSRNKLLPFKGFYWMYSIRSVSVAAVFSLEFINIFVAYYWIDTIIRITASLFSIALVIMQVVYYREMKDMKSPEEYALLAAELKQVSKELEELKAAINE